VVGYAQLADVAIGDGHPVRIAGVINVSPESFFAGSISRDAEQLAARARAMVEEGADLIDIGAMSTAPYLETVIDEDEERRRMEWAVGVVAAAVSTPISADTQRATVAAAALAAGARLINDVSGLAADPRMAAVASMGEGVILMANESGPSAEEPIELCRLLLGACLERADRAGIARERVVLDPGIGFFRRGRVPWDQFDLTVLRQLDRLRDLGRPLLVGVSRKSFLGKLTGRAAAADRLAGSLAAAAIAVDRGAGVIRTHDVAATRDAVRVAEALRPPDRGGAPAT
jgi:dihydropteroate synthase